MDIGEQLHLDSIKEWKNHIKNYDFGPKLASDKPSIYFQSQIHGNETLGTLVLSNLISFLKNLKPHSILSPIRIVHRVNPFSWYNYLFSKNGLYDPNSGNNWNRIFNWEIYAKELTVLLNRNDHKNEHKILSKLIKLAIENQNTDLLTEYISSRLFELSFGYKYIVDLHTPENGIEHLYCSKFNKNLPSFQIPYVIEYGSPTSKVFDEAHMKLVERFLSYPILNGNLAVTIELDSNVPASEDIIEKWTNRIIVQLIDLNILDLPYHHHKTNDKSKRIYIGKMIDYRSHISGIQYHYFKLGEKLSYGDKVFGIKPFLHEDKNEIVKSVCECIPLCLRKHTIVSAGNWVVRALQIMGEK